MFNEYLKAGEGFSADAFADAGSFNKAAPAVKVSVFKAVLRLSERSVIVSAFLECRVKYTLDFANATCSENMDSQY
jgi:hypothetical protein